MASTSPIGEPFTVREGKSVVFASQLARPEGTFATIGHGHSSKSWVSR